MSRTKRCGLILTVAGVAALGAAGTAFAHPHVALPAHQGDGQVIANGQLHAEPSGLNLSGRAFVEYHGGEMRFRIMANADRGSWNGWHVHDGTAVPSTDADGLTHRGVAIFPAIFTGGNAAAYVADPSLWAYCPNATDKALLGDGVVHGSKSAAGVCFNENSVIHLLNVPEGQSAPTGWSLIPGTTTGYYMLTASG